MTITIDSSDTITVMRSAYGLRQSKVLSGPQGQVESSTPGQFAKVFDAQEYRVSGLDDIEALLHRLLRIPSAYVVRGQLINGPSVKSIFRRLHDRPGEPATLRDVPRRWLALDLDNITISENTDTTDLQSCADFAFALLPAEFQGCDCIVQASGSHGVKPGARLRLWFWLDRPVHGYELKYWLPDRSVFDAAVFSAAEPIFTAAPDFVGGVTEHLHTRLLRLLGDPIVTVPLIDAPVISSRSDCIPPEADIEDIIAALAVIPNDSQDWGNFNYMCMATWRATGGSQEGLDAFNQWSSKHEAHDEKVCAERWAHYFNSPPSDLGAGSLIWLAQQADSDWVQPSRLAPSPDVDFKDAEKLPDDIDLVPLPDSHWTDRLALKIYKDGSKGGPLANVANAIIAFKYAPEWTDTLAYDEFSNRPKLLGPPPWVNLDPREAKRLYPRDAHDDDVVMANSWLQGRGKISSIPLSVVKDAWATVSKHNGYHPVKIYLNSLVWDGVSRINTWLMDHLGVEDTPLHQAFGSKFLISAVARIFEPGCKVDTVLVLEGPQGLKKSQTLQTLANGWYTDHIPDLTSKDAAIQIQGVWIVEHAEFDKLGRAESNRAKAFISTGTDRFRPPFGTCSEDFPRQCVFAATLNPTATGYLNDETGARRYWPVLCGKTWRPGQKVDIQKLITTRDQLWAEALVRYRLGDVHWLDGDFEALQSTATESRFTRDPWANRVEKAIADVPFATITGILEGILGVPVGMINKGHQDRIGKILRAADWSVGTKRHDVDGISVQVRGFCNPAAKFAELLDHGEGDGEMGFRGLDVEIHPDHSNVSGLEQARLAKEKREKRDREEIASRLEIV